MIIELVGVSCEVGEIVENDIMDIYYALKNVTNHLLPMHETHINVYLNEIELEEFIKFISKVYHFNLEEHISKEYAVFTAPFGYIHLKSNFIPPTYNCKEELYIEISNKQKEALKYIPDHLKETDEEENVIGVKCC